MTPWLGPFLALPPVAAAAAVRRAGPVAAAVAACVGLACTTLAAVAVAVAGAFTPGPLAAAELVAAGLAHLAARSLRELPRLRAPRRTALGFVLIGLLGLALRWPPMLFPMGGRDQGTYLLRARALARTGRIDLHDPLLAELGRTPTPGDEDVTGLYRTSDAPHRRGRYEGAYRPGFYLASLRDGRIVPQFLHGQPALLAAGTLAFGRGHEGIVVLAEALLALLAFAALALAALPAPWAWAAAVAYTVAPVTVWTLRQTLSEPLAAAFVAAAAAWALHGRTRGTTGVALLLAAWAATRADAWPPAALAVALSALSAPAGRRRTVAGAAVLLAAVVVVSIVTSYPYVHDEVARAFGIDASRGALATAGALAALATATPLLLPPRLRDRLWRLVPVAERPTLLGLLVLGFVAWFAEPGSGRAARLDPLPAVLDPWGVALAAAGAVVCLRRPPPTNAAPAPVAVALRLAAAATFAAFAVRNLPRAHLYYYGRYLVPLLFPAAVLLLAALSERIFAAVRRGGRSTAALLAASLPLLAALGPARVFVAAPVTRLAEFADAGAGLDALAARIPQDAVVIAGGEGWHGGHTFNQVGGALAIDHGRRVLPYRTDEEAYAAAYHLLVRRPTALGTTPPPVFLLRNEASLPRDGPDGAAETIVDDEVPPPLAVRRRLDVDLVYDRLTPTSGALPRRVTRDGIRMVLLELYAAPDAPSGPIPAVQGCATKQHHVEVPVPDDPSVRALRVETAGGSAAVPAVVRKQGRSTRLGEPRPRRTFGPIPVRPGERLALVGASARPGTACPGVRIEAAQFLGPLRRAPAPAERLVHRPADLLGVPAPPAAFRAGRAYSAKRPTVTAPPTVGLSFRLSARTPVDFGPVLVPRDGACPLDVSLTLRRRDVEDGARVEVSVGDARAVFPVSRDGPGVLRTASIRIAAPGPVAPLSVRLATPRPETDEVHLRDVVLAPACPPPSGDGAGGVPSGPTP